MLNPVVKFLGNHSSGVKQFLVGWILGSLAQCAWELDFKHNIPAAGIFTVETILGIALWILIDIIREITRRLAEDDDGS